MKKLFIPLVVLFIVSSTALIAQNKVFTMEEAILGGNGKLLPDNLPNLQWKNNEWVSYTTSEGKLMVKNAKTNEDAKELWSVELYNSVKKETNTPDAKALPKHSWIDENTLLFETNDFIATYNFPSAKFEVLHQIPKGAENIDYNPTSKHLAYTKGNELLVKVFGKNKTVSLVGLNEDGSENKGIVMGQSVHRNEWGITKGTFWSKSGKLLAFYQMNEMMVEDYPIMDVTKIPATVKNIKYPMAGRTSHQVKVGVTNPESGRTVYLKAGVQTDMYFTNICFDNEDKLVYLQILNREQNEMQLKAFNTTNGMEVKTLYTEKHPKYVEPLHPLIFLPKKSDKFIFQSAKDGYNHLYLMDDDGKIIKQLTQGNWEVTDVLGFDEKGENVIFASTQTSPLDNTYFQVNIKKGVITPLSANPNGVHSLILNPNNTLAIDKYSTQTIPRNIEIVEVKNGKKIQTLLEAKNPIADYQMPQIKVFTIKAEDGVTDLYCRLITPPNYDANKKYPAVVYVYGGPHAQMITNSWNAGANLWFNLMAQKGFVLFTVDNRGSMHRGRDFEQATHRQLGTIEMQDQLSGLKYLKNLSFIDSNRVGVHGWSFGGFMTTSLMTRTPWAFKAGVAGGPVIDWSMYEIMYTERYMDAPKENLGGYNASNLLNYVKNLKGKLLMIHGTSDDVVVWQHSLLYTKKCVEEGIQIDYFMYPNHPHNVRGKDRIHLMQKVSDYFDMHLK